MTYTKLQLVNALISEHEFYSHDMDMPMSLDAYKQYLDSLTVKQLIAETATDASFTLDEFMSSY